LTGACAFAADAPQRLNIKGVAVPPTVEIGGKQLVLNGAGLRTKLVFKVYVGALYLEAKTARPEEIITRDQVRRMELTFLRNVDGAAIAEAVDNGFALNAKFRKGEGAQRLAAFRKMIPDLKKGDVLAFTYLPGRGLEASRNNKSLGTVAGKDFADALYSVWVGANPADKKLRAALLGGSND